MYFPITLLIVDTMLLAGAIYFISQAFREKEKLAVRKATWGALILVLFAFLIWFVPSFRIPAALFFLAVVLYTFLCFLPGKKKQKGSLGTLSFIKGKPVRIDERDIPFARHRSLKPGTEIYRCYYKEHPEKEALDAARREKGLLGTPGSIDDCFPPLVAMVKTTFTLPGLLGPHAVAEPMAENIEELAPEKATRIIKNYAMHLGADLVGICRVNPLWVYSHRGEIHYENWEDWGVAITDVPSYAVVFCTEMDKDHVDTAPHTPSLAESGANYAKGAYISTLLAYWFAHMGYRGIAEHNRHYNLVLPPLAVDAGLGEIGRMGYLITPAFGPRVRVFATLTDMPLIPDQPVSLGVDEFCRKCKKCADACPSRSIPRGEKTIHNGIEKWKINEDSCFDYWSKVGTDCCVCMAICPFSRPDTFLHRIVRFCVACSPLAQKTFPYIDNFLYGKKWRSRKTLSWINMPKNDMR